MGIELVDARSAITLLSFLTFVGIIRWAWSSRRKDAFADAAHLPFADEDSESMVEEKRS
jgi:cytochrome c oxidase cbb3-type subunit 4